MFTPLFSAYPCSTRFSISTMLDSTICFLSPSHETCRRRCHTGCRVQGPCLEPDPQSRYLISLFPARVHGCVLDLLRQKRFLSRHRVLCFFLSSTSIHHLGTKS